MMKSYSKLLALLMAALMLVSITAGCKSTEPAVEETPAPTVAVAETAEPTSEPVPEAKMAPGTYNAEGWGYSPLEPIYVSVTVTETEITDIQVETNWEKTRENVPILNTVVNCMLPVIIENQTVNVDTICGATASSVGVKSAVRAALEAAFVAAGEDAAAVDAKFMTAPAKSDSTETIDVDILVVGMGGSGCAAAVSAAETLKSAGKEVNVLAIDKTGKYGGTSANCGEPMAVNPTRFKTEFNNGEDYMDADAFRAAWIAYTEGDEKTELLDVFLNNSGDTLDWLYYDHSFKFNKPMKGFSATDTFLCKYQYAYFFNAEEGRDYGMDVTEGTRTETVMKYFDSFISDYESNGGKYMLQTEAYELITDASGAVVGVKARNTGDGSEYVINAKKVIMACGGFAGNGKMEEEYLSNEYYPLKASWRIYGMAQNDGKLMDYAIKQLNAGTYNIEMPPMVHFKTAPMYLPMDYEINEYESATGPYAFLRRLPVWGLGGVPQNMALNSDCLWVDMEGNRFCNEAGTFQFWKSGPTYYNIWGADEVAEVAANGFKTAAYCTVYTRGNMKPGIPVPEIYDLIDVAVEMGIAYKGDTIEELAAAMNVPAENLKNSIEKYNAACAAGVDEEFGKNAENLISLGENGPYYCFVGQSVVYSTCGGLDIDTSFNVLKSDGVTPIENLYAVGNDSMGVLYSPKKAYVTFGGGALGWAYTSGRLAGANAANALTE